MLKVKNVKHSNRLDETQVDSARGGLCALADVLLPVEASAEALLVAGCGLHHAGAHRHLHLPV